MHPFVKYALIALLAGAVVVGVVIIVQRVRHASRYEPSGFGDWVKDPKNKQAAEKYFAAREALQVPANITDEEIQRMVERLFIQKDEDFNKDRLKLLGTKAVPFLVQALTEDRTAKSKFPEADNWAAAKSPFEQICNLLEPLAPPEAAIPLAPYANHADNHFRNYAALGLGNIGSADCIEPVLKLLDDEDDYVRSYAMIGIGRSLEAKRADREFTTAVFPALVKLLNRNDQSVGGSPPTLLLTIDRGRALPVLLSPEFFTTSNRELQFILRALNRASERIPHERLLPLLSELQPLSNKYPRDNEYSEALVAYAHNPDQGTEALLRAELESTNDDVREAAANALGILSGITDPHGVVFGLYESQGFSSLSAAQQHYCAVFIYDAEVRNGGHSQYFVNSSGDHWKMALRGLEAVGAMQRVAILQEAAGLFGSGGPPDENGARHRQLARFSAAQDKRLDELNNRYYECKESVDSLLSLYAIENKHEFTQPTK